jgi:hypothetical protein
MLKENDTLARAYAVEILSTLNEYARINKEKLFADAVAYYRWRLADKKALEALDTYWYEFKAHHKSLVAGMQPEVRVACFITWFVEQHFHTLPPITGNGTSDLALQTSRKRARFSSPSFRLPTGDPVESYLIQWLFWHLDNPPAPGAQPDRLQLHRWAKEMLEEVMEDHKLSSEEFSMLFKDAALFFAWSLEHLHSWNAFMDLFVAFLKSEEGLATDQSDTPFMDACFVHWFCQHSLLCPAQNRGELAIVQDQSVPTEE